MDKNFRGWMTAGIVAMVLTIFVIVSAFSYFSDLKEMLAKSEENSRQLQAQLAEKANQVTAKDQELAKKSEEIVSKEQELTRRLEEVRKLQGSVKTVGRCLLGTMGAIDALQKNDEAQARQALLLIQSTCQESSNIIKQVEGFSTNSQ